MTEDEILNAYPDLEREDIREALRFAAEAVRERELPASEWWLKFRGIASLAICPM